jgi:protoporphyrinogen oxidase
MVLVYLLLEQDRFTPFDAHYVPDPNLPFSRISEPKNYSGRNDPAGRTVLCAEIPCSQEDPVWTLPPSELTVRVKDAMTRAGLPIESRILDTIVRRLPAAYPIYRRGYESDLQTLEDWIGKVPGLVTFGRQGLFTHDNAHHALFMGRSAVECIRSSGDFDLQRWAAFKELFATHVVED